MKLFFVILLNFFLNKSCDSQSMNDFKTAQIEYVAHSRGFYQKITIKDQMVLISNDRNYKEKPIANKISNTDWEEIKIFLQTIELNKLRSLKAPTQKRLFDGAPTANFKIIFKDSTYQTNGFDHGFPPESIKKIVDKLIKIAKKNNEH